MEDYAPFFVKLELFGNWGAICFSELGDAFSLVKLADPKVLGCRLCC